MHRRRFLQSILAAVPLFLSTTGSCGQAKAATHQKETMVLVQRSPVAGFQFYDGELLWNTLRPGHLLELVPEPDNRYDPDAVKVMWQGRQLGYLPANENVAVSHMLLGGQRLEGRIVALQRSHDPWERISIEVFLIIG